MRDLILTLLGLLIPALIAYGVYVYRPRIGFMSRGFSDYFNIEDGKIAHGRKLSRTEIEIGSIELRNDTQTDVENFKIIFEIDLPCVDIQASRTTNLAKSAISIRYDEGGAFIEIERFPSKERIVLSYSSIGRSGLMYREPKKVGGKFNLYSIDTQRRAIKYMFIGLYYVVLVIIIAIMSGWLVSEVLDLF